MFNCFGWFDNGVGAVFGNRIIPMLLDEYGDRYRSGPNPTKRNAVGGASIDVLEAAIKDLNTE